MESPHCASHAASELSQPSDSCPSQFPVLYMESFMKTKSLLLVGTFTLDSIDSTQYGR